MMEKCEECGSNDLKVDNVRGEIVCNDCGLVIDDKASAGQNDNAGSMWGEGASNTPTKDESKIKTGSKGNGLGSYIGKRGEAKGKWKILSQLHAQDAKDLHPMAQATMDAAKKLAGKDNAMKAKRVITLSTVPLEGDEKKALEKVTDKNEVKLPKNSVCRKKTRGGSTSNNERLLALGCMKAYQDWTGRINIDWQQMLQGTGLTMAQVTAAARVIRQYLIMCEKAGLIEKKVDRKTVSERVRTLEIENTTLALKQLLDGLDEELKTRIIDDYKQRLLLLGEPTVDASPFASTNIEARVLCAILFQISCEAFGVDQGRLEKIADAVGKCRNTIKNWLKSLLRMVAAGEIVDFGVLSKEF